MIKPAASTDAHILRLRNRGMEVDEELAKQWLENVSYYRLSGYWYPFRRLNHNSPSERLDEFEAGTTFSDVAALYEFDRKLRGLVFDGIERIEVALRTRLIEATCHGNPLAYRSHSTFREGFDHSRWLENVDKRIARARKQNRAIKHYAEKYDGTYPFWVVAEVLDFSDISIMFEGLPTGTQFSIADELGIRLDFSQLSTAQQKRAKRGHPLVRWFEQLSVIRNTCAHHSRLWNHAFIPVSTVALRTHPNLDALPTGQSEKLYGAIELIKVLLGHISPGTTWPDKYEALLRSSFDPINGRSRTEMGIPTPA